MNPVTIRLLPHEQRQRPSAAYVLPGADVDAWLAELSRWHVPQVALRLYPLPALPGANEPDGIFVWTPEVEVAATPWATTYGRLGSRLYLPTHAGLSPSPCSGLPPAIGADEIDGMLACELAVFHPRHGLVCFDAEEAMTVADLLVGEAAVAMDWLDAHPGLLAAPGLISITAQVPLSMDDFLESSRDDIARSPVGDPDSPKLDGDSKLQGMLDWASDQGLKMLGKLNKPPASNPSASSPGAQGPGMGAKLAGGLQRGFTAMSEALMARRFREVNRLMELLQKDPDQGLRHALPMGGGQPGSGFRGFAMPGWRLGSHNVDFNLGNLRGGGPIDLWAIPWDLQQRLTTTYRQLANRELRLGRFRRAAYIFAELIGDYESAASALQRGRFYREAAALYRDHLKKPLDAAKCLAEGGLLQEAIAIYEAHEHYVEAGELYEKVGRADEAQRVRRLAVEQHVKSGNIVAAANLLETVLQEPDEALALLTDAWPHSHQARACLDARIDLLGRLGRHDSTLALVRTLGTKVPVHHRYGTAELLARRAGNYPDPRVRTWLADSARVLIGGILTSEPGDIYNLMRILRASDPNDRLLARDANRFHSLRQQRRSHRVESRELTEDVVITTRFELPQNVAWEQVQRYGQGLMGVGLSMRKLIATEAHWSGECHAAELLPTTSEGQSLLLAIPRSGDGQVLVHTGGDLAVARTLSADRHLQVNPSWMPAGVRALAYGSGDEVWMITDNAEGLLLSGYRDSSFLLATYPIPGAMGLMGAPLSLFVQRNAVLVGLGERLLTLRHGHFEEQALGTTIHRIVGTPDNIRPRLAVMLETGVAVVWTGYEAEATEFCANDFRRPLATFVRNGLLVVIGDQEGRVYATHRQRVEMLHAFGIPAGEALTVLPGRHRDEFAVVYRSGVVRCFRLPMD